jgi:RNA-directed DNA polymerase
MFNSAQHISRISSADQLTQFTSLFSAQALRDRFDTDFSQSPAKGTDRLNGFQFAARADTECHIAARKCLNGDYRFAPYLEKLKVKGRDKPPRLIGIPTIRDRIVLSQLNRFLTFMYPERVPKNIAADYVRRISDDLMSRSPTETWVCSTDIKTFYDKISRERLLKVLSRKIDCLQALCLLNRALNTPIVPRNARRSRHKDIATKHGVPQGLAISNILASIYMQDVDEPMSKLGLVYYRYVDDVLFYGDHEAVQKALRSLRSRLGRRGLSLHPESSGKTILQPLSDAFGYLGYIFKYPHITVRDSSVERLLQSLAAKFSDFAHNKTRRLERFNYLTESRLADIFLMELNERITGAICKKRRYGWIAYFNQITDLSLLHRLDRAISGMFDRLPEFNHQAPEGLRKLSRAYFEMKFNPSGGYIRDYDRITTRVEKLTFLEQRGRVNPSETLTDDQINDRFERYVHRSLASMHSDENTFYG